jgi:hypothetical protein
VGSPDPPEIGDRPVPFTIRVAADWTNRNDEDRIADSEFHFWIGRARLTGALSITSDGQDLQFSDLGVL